MHNLRGSALLLLLGGGMTVVTPSCSPDPATSITVAISSEADVPTEIDAISIEVKRGDRVVFAQPYKLDRSSGTARLPGTLSLKLHPDEEPEASLKLTVRADLIADQVVLRTATMNFVEGKSKLLRILLRYSCFDFPKACGEGQTCVGGECASDFVDTAKLPDVTGSSAFPKVSEGGCFNTSDTACASKRTVVSDAAAFVSAGCAWDTSKDAGFKAGSLNVFASWAVQGDNRYPVVLDLDPQEGWSFAPGSTSTFKLAPGLCELFKSQKIVDVSFNFACPTKTSQQPVCEPDLEPTKATTLADSACSGCAYAPPDCSAPLAAAKAAAASGPLLKCAFECPYDGRYDSISECQTSRSCFFGCLAPYLDCTDKGTCASFKEMDAWRACLDQLGSIDARCAVDCSKEHVSVCRE